MSEFTDRLAVNRQRMQESLGDQLEVAMRGLWVSTDPSDASLSAYREAVVDPVNLARTVVGRAATAYFALWAAGAGQRVLPSVDPDEVAVLASSVDRWAAAPVVRLRKLLSDGVDYDVAHAEAGTYADRLGALELTWADLQVMDAQYGDKDVRWRRVTSGDPCDFCSLIAAKPYKKIKQIKVHAHCRCIVAPYHVDVDGLWKDLPRAA